jgi:hypothetical protein
MAKTKKKKKQETDRFIPGKGPMHRAMDVDVLVLGGVEEYRKAEDVLKTSQQLWRKLDAHITMNRIMTSELSYVRPTKSRKKKKKEGEEKPKRTGITLKTDAKLEKLQGMRDAHRDGEDIPKGPLQVYAPIWKTWVEEIEAKGGPYFASHVWDSGKKQLNGMRNRPMKDYGNAPRSWVEVQGTIGSMRLQNFTLPIMRHPNSDGKTYAWLRVEGEGKNAMYILRCQYGRQHDFIDFVLHGKVLKPDGKTHYEVKLTGYQRGIIDKIIAGEDGWDFQTPEIHLKHMYKKKKFYVNIRYTRPRTEPRNRSKRVCEVVWDHVMGYELPRRKHEQLTNEKKRYVIHAMSLNTDGSRSKEWPYRIPVNGMINRMRFFRDQKERLENERDTLRKFPRRTREWFRRTIKTVSDNRRKEQRIANHTWALQLVRFARRSNCGTIKVYNVPDGTSAGLLLDGTIAWEWNQFVTLLKHKADAEGITVEIVKNARYIQRILSEIVKRRDDGDENLRASS